MSLQGNAEGASLKGKINKLTELRGYSAYEIAVIYGFEGTEEEWLATLKAVLTEGDKQNIINDLYNRMARPAKIGYVSLYADNWNGTESPYSQVVSIPGVTENSQVDLTPSVEQLSIFHHKDLAFVTENVGGTVTVYAIGQKPVNDYIIQVTITEVDE